MDQSIGVTELSKLAMTAMGTSLAGNAAKTAGAVEGQFQKLLERRGKPVEKPAKPKDTEDKAPADGSSRKPQTGEEQKPEKTEKEEPVGETPREDPVERAKKLAEQGFAVLQPIMDETLPLRRKDLKVDEFIAIDLDRDTFFVPGRAELQPVPPPPQEVMGVAAGPEQVIDVSDPKADAMLEATDPTVDHSLGKVLEKVVDEQAGEIIREAAEQVEAPEEDVEVEVTGHEAEAEPVFHDVKAAPIKVGETLETQQVQDVNEQIAAQLIPAMEQGQTKVELQLTPEHLGVVKVEITRNENGALHIAITAESSHTRSLLEKHSDSLQGLLAARSQNTVQVEVMRQEGSQPKNPYDGHNGQNQQQQQPEQHRPRHSRNSQDFMHQLRLGLVTETPDEA